MALHSNSIDDEDRLTVSTLRGLACTHAQGSLQHTALLVAIDAIEDRIRTRERIAQRYSEAGATVGDHPWP